MKQLITLIVCCSFLHPLSAQDEVYGDNVIGITPVGAYGSDNVDDVYFGFFYERLLAENVGLKVPMRLGLNNDMFQTGVSLKLYPGGHDGIFKFAVAPTIVYTKGHNDYIDYRYEPLSSSPRNESTDFNQLGFMVLGSLNWCLNESLYFGGEAGFGINYYDEPVEGEIQYRDTRLNGLIEFNLGYRF